MEIRNKKIIISEDEKENAFLDCKLGREQYAEALTSVVSNYKKGFVLAINNKWGDGKSTFVQMWEKYLKQKTFKTIFFNAWENDFHDDVMIALLSELRKHQEDHEEFFAKVLHKALPLFKGVGNELLKHAVGKITGEKGAQIIIEGLGEYSVDQLKRNLDDFNAKKESIVSFRDSLENFVNNRKDDKPIVFIIDELDRCRPNYAVSALEKIKHLFSVEGIVFVLAIDKIQLGHAIRGVYGSEQIDATEYLRRFIDVEFSLPKPDSKEYIDFLIDHYGLKSYYENPIRRSHNRTTDNDLNSLVNILDWLIHSGKITLRELEKIMGIFSITVSSMTPTLSVNPMCILFIAFLKIKSEDGFYSKFKDRQLTLQEIVDKTVEVFMPLPDPNYHSYFIWFQAEITFFYWNYLMKKDSRVVLYKGRPNESDFKLEVYNEADDEFSSLKSSIKDMILNSSRYGRNVISQIIPNIDLTKSVSV